VDRSRRDRAGGAGSGATVKARTRGWAGALAWAAGLAIVAVAVSATVNPALGRTVHWDRMAALAVVVFVVLAVSLRRRWL